MVAEIQDVTVAVQPVRPLVTGKRDETPRLVETACCVEDGFPRIRTLVEKTHPPMVVIGERDDVERRDIARVPKIVVRGTGPVRQLRVTMEVAPNDSGNPFAHDERVAGSREAAGGGVHAIDAGLVDDGVDVRNSSL